MHVCSKQDWDLKRNASRFVDKSIPQSESNLGQRHCIDLSDFKALLVNFAFDICWLLAKHQSSY